MVWACASVQSNGRHSSSSSRAVKARGERPSNASGAVPASRGRASNAEARAKPGRRRMERQRPLPDRPVSEQQADGEQVLIGLGQQSHQFPFDAGWVRCRHETEPVAETPHAAQGSAAPRRGWTPTLAPGVGQWNQGRKAVAPHLGEALPWPSRRRIDVRFSIRSLPSSSSFYPDGTASLSPASPQYVANLPVWAGRSSFLQGDG